MKFQLGLDRSTSLALTIATLSLVTASLAPTATATDLSQEASVAPTASSLLEGTDQNFLTDSSTSSASQSETLTTEAEASVRAIAPTLQAQALPEATTSPSSTTINGLSQEPQGRVNVPSGMMKLTPVSQLESQPKPKPSMAQVTSVSQLSDVQPTDWAFQALQSLVERYGCIEGYPDQTYRGNRAVSRYEFAAGLNACLTQITAVIEEVSGDQVQREDLETLQRLQEEFSAELATLRGRVDALEARTAELEANQFSTTTKLFGQAIFGVQGRTPNDADFFPVDGIPDTEDPSTEINVISNVQLSLFTQFSNRSVLLTGLQAGDGSTAPRLSNDTRLGYEGDTNNDFILSDLSFRQLIGNNFAVIVGPSGVNPVNVFRGANRVESAGQGPLSAFAQRNPVIAVGNGRGGLGFDWQINPRISLQGVYSASSPDDPRTGLFGGDDGETSLGAQLTVSPTDTIDIALHYVNAYSPFGRLGTGIGEDQLTGGAALKTDAFGATVSWRLTPGITIGGWGGYTNSRIPNRDGNVETVNWMAFLNFPDLFGEGNLGGIYVGQPPHITSSDLPVGQNIPSLLAGGLGTEGDQLGTTTHVEAFYRFRVSDNITLTPGFILLFEPGNTPGSDTIGIGALRTTFTF